jgi:tetratricopeptide (TPR) repeat protein
MRAALLLLSMTLVLATPVTAQTYDELVARGDSLDAALDPAGALEAYRQAFTVQQSYEAMWKFSVSQVDVAKQLEGNEYRDLRDSLYDVARTYAEAAIRADSNDAEGHFAYANALGQLSRTRGGRERVRFAREIYDATARALALNPDHPGALHVIGAWHAEIRRLSGLTRFFARTLLGAGFMSRASRDSAVVHLERSVANEPDYLFHHLELAQVYLELDRDDDARRELEAVLALPPTSDVLDEKHQAEARRLLAELRPNEP